MSNELALAFEYSILFLYTNSFLTVVQQKLKQESFFFQAQYWAFLQFYAFFFFLHNAGCYLDTVHSYEQPVATVLSHCFSYL